MRRIIRSRAGRPCRRRLLRTPLPDRRTLVWQQDRGLCSQFPVLCGLVSQVIRVLVHVCDHVQRWPQPLTSNYPIYLQIGTSLA